MEDNFSKKTILLLFGVLLASFLFVYKGFFVNGANYLEEINQYKQSIYSFGQANNKTSLAQSTLKRTKLASDSSSPSGGGNRTKSKIPQELSSIDNNILELKALMQNLNDKHNKIIKSVETIQQSTQRLEDLTEVSKELLYIKEQQSRIDTDIEDLSSNVERLREYF